MKTIVIALTSAAALCAAVLAAGFALDCVAVFSILVASVFVGMFASDYSRDPTYRLEPVRREPKLQAEAHRVECPTMGTVNSTAS